MTRTEYWLERSGAHLVACSSTVLTAARRMDAMNLSFQIVVDECALHARSAPSLDTVHFPCFLFPLHLLLPRGARGVGGVRWWCGGDRTRTRNITRWSPYRPRPQRVTECAILLLPCATATRGLSAR
jgi:hypothetical protein